MNTLEYMLFLAALSMLFHFPYQFIRGEKVTVASLVVVGIIGGFLGLLISPFVLN